MQEGETMKTNKENPPKNLRPSSIGGQALIEGVMMKSSDDIAMAVRKSSGEIVVKKEPVNRMEKSSLYKIPIIRGVIAFINSMIIGVKAITYSAEVFEEIDPDLFVDWIENQTSSDSDISNSDNR